MLRLAYLLLAFFLLQNLHADNFKHCHEVVKKSYKFSQTKHLYQTVYGWLLFSLEEPKEYVRSEPTLGLYLVDEKNYPKALKVYDKFPKEVAALTHEAFQMNTIVSEAQGFDRLAKLQYPSYFGVAVFGKCCTLRGFVSSEGLVTSDYMLRFLRDKKRFATAGVRLEKVKERIVVRELNTFFEFNPFHINDEILAFDGAKYSLNDLNKKILFSQVGSKHTFTIKRAGKKMDLKLYLKERLGGGALGDTFMEQYGLRFTKDLKIAHLDKGGLAVKQGLKIGDRLKALNNINLSDDASLRGVFSQGRPGLKMRLLFERAGLQFNIYLPHDIMLTLQK